MRQEWYHIPIIVMGRVRVGCCKCEVRHIQICHVLYQTHPATSIHVWKQRTKSNSIWILMLNLGLSSIVRHTRWSESSIIGLKLGKFRLDLGALVVLTTVILVRGEQSQRQSQRVQGQLLAIVVQGWKKPPPEIIWLHFHLVFLRFGSHIFYTFISFNFHVSKRE